MGKIPLRQGRIWANLGMWIAGISGLGWRQELDGWGGKKIALQDPGATSPRALIGNRAPIMNRNNTVWVGLCLTDSGGGLANWGANQA